MQFYLKKKKRGEAMIKGKRKAVIDVFVVVFFS